MLETRILHSNFHINMLYEHVVRFPFVDILFCALVLNKTSTWTSISQTLRSTNVFRKVSSGYGRKYYGVLLNT